MIRNRDEQRGRGPMRDRDTGEKEFGERKRRKVCRFCENKIQHIDHKDERLLRRFVTERGKIVPRRISGNCAIHQRKLTLSIKRCRHLAILAFSVESYR